MNNDVRFFKYVRDFLMVYLPKHRCLSDNTIKCYRDTINLLVTFLKMEKGVMFKKITFKTFNHTVLCEFLDWLECERHSTASTRNQRLVAIRAFFKYAAMEDATLMIAYVELDKVPFKKLPKGRVPYLSEEALAAILRQPDTSTRLGLRNRFFMILMYETGARIQEVLDLRLKDLHPNAQSPCVYLTGKGNKVRAVPLFKKTLEHLNVYLNKFHLETTRKSDALLFYIVIKGNTGKISQDAVASFLKKYGETARGICADVPEKLHAHLFRHGRAMALYKAGMPLSYIKDFLGHASVNTTDIYAFADITMMKEAFDRVNTNTPAEAPVWEADEKVLLRLCGL